MKIDRFRFSIFYLHLLMIPLPRHILNFQPNFTPSNFQYNDINFFLIHVHYKLRYNSFVTHRPFFIFIFWNSIFCCNHIHSLISYSYPFFIHEFVDLITPFSFFSLLQLAITIHNQTFLRQNCTMLYS